MTRSSRYSLSAAWILTLPTRLVSYSSGSQWVKGRHSIKFGGEQRVFFNYFWQPDNPTGIFNFSRDVTTSQPNNGLGDDDTRRATRSPRSCLGIPMTPRSHLVPAVADKSKETAFYVQDDWKVTPKLTVNVGLRYEWSTPYTERYNRLQFNDFTGDTGISIPVRSRWLADSFRNWGRLGKSGDLGVSDFRTPQLTCGQKQLGSAFGVRLSTCAQHRVAGRRGSVLRNERRHQLPVCWPGVCQDGLHVISRRIISRPSSRVLGLRHIQPTCTSPFPGGLAAAAGNHLRQTGAVGLRELERPGHRDRSQCRDLSMEPGNSALAAGADCNWGGLLGQPQHSLCHGPEQAGFPPAIATSCPRQCAIDSCKRLTIPRINPPDPTLDPTWVTDYLNTEVPNPFQCFFSTSAALTGPWCPANPIFNAADVADSRYVDDTIPQQLLLEPYPQFDGGFEGLPKLIATSWYHSLQIRFQKRASHYISFEGNYTFSKSTDDSSAGRNAWIGNLGLDNPQVLDNLKVEHGIGSNDAPHRLTAAVILDLPFGKDRVDWTRHESVCWMALWAAGH